MRLPAIVVFCLASWLGASAQSPSGTWIAMLPGGATLTLDLTVAGTAVTGTMTLMTPGEGIKSVLQKGTLTGSSLSFLISTNEQSRAFAGEFAGDELRLRPADSGAAPLVFKRVEVGGATQTPAVTTPPGWRSTSRSAQIIEEAGRSIVRIDERAGEGVVWFEGAALRDGTIDLEMRGKDVVGQSFVGVAFRAVDDTHYDVVYFRPFNFRTTDPDRRMRAVQYHSSPEFPWARLRAEKPNEYEKPVAPVPDPNGWFKVRVFVDGPRVEVFVNDSPTPTLTVAVLTPPRGGMVGLWVGNGSGGDFANLRVAPKQ
jgi:hypothetical protein